MLNLLLLINNNHSNQIILNVSKKKFVTWNVTIPQQINLNNELNEYDVFVCVI